MLGIQNTLKIVVVHAYPGCVFCEISKDFGGINFWSKFFFLGGGGEWFVGSPRDFLKFFEVLIFVPIRGFFEVF